MSEPNQKIRLVTGAKSSLGVLGGVEPTAKIILTLVAFAAAVVGAWTWMNSYVSADELATVRRAQDAIDFRQDRAIDEIGDDVTQLLRDQATTSKQVDWLTDAMWIQVRDLGLDEARGRRPAVSPPPKPDATPEPTP